MLFRRFILLCLVIAIALVGGYGYITIEQYGLPELASMVSVYGVAAIIFAESGLLFGFFLPGDSLIFTTAFLTYQGVIQFDVHMMAALFFVAAVVGDSVGYMIGRHVGRRLFRRKESLLFHQRNLKYAEDFYRRHGGKTIILARFIPVARTFAPLIAGTCRMPYRTFLLYNLIGAFIWAVGATYLGYYAGAWAESAGSGVQYIAFAILFIPFAFPIIKIFNGIIIRSRRRRIHARRNKVGGV